VRSHEEFDSFGPTVRTLRGFIKSYHDLIGAIRDIVLPDPDMAPAGPSRAAVAAPGAAPAR
jgi:hypothetical protein